MVEVVSEVAWSRLEDQIRQVPLLNQRNGETVYPYEDADITLANFTYDQVRTTSLYVARSLLAVQSEIAIDIGDYEPLELEGGLVLSSLQEGKEVLTGYVPPIVEVTPDAGAYLLDGSHRTNRGRWMGRVAFTAVRIANIRPDCPAYAYPNNWDEVKIYEEPPSDPKMRKKYRDGDLYKLYRDFSGVNGSKPRTASSD